MHVVDGGVTVQVNSMSPLSSLFCGAALVMWINTADAALNYSCNTAGDITIVNPYKDTHLSVFAKNSDQNCTASLLNERASIFITGCDMNKRIEVTLSEEEGSVVMEDGIIKTSIVVHTVQCNEIPMEGINRTIQDDSWVTNMLVTTQQPSVTPEIPVDSFVYDPETGMQKESAYVGESIMWEIEGPVGYIVLPVSCTAYAGSSSNTSESLYVISYGCSLKKGLMTDFHYKSETERHILIATVYVFRWESSNEVSLMCSIMACAPTSYSCDFFCGPYKRSLFDIWQMFADKITTPPTYRERRSRRVELRASTDVTYRVYGAANIMILHPLTNSQRQLTLSKPAVLLALSILISRSI